MNVIPVLNANDTVSEPYAPDEGNYVSITCADTGSREREGGREEAGEGRKKEEGRGREREGEGGRGKEDEGGRGKEREREGGKWRK